MTDDNQRSEAVMAKTLFLGEGQVFDIDLIEQDQDLLDAYNRCNYWGGSKHTDWTKADKAGKLYFQGKGALGGGVFAQVRYDANAGAGRGGLVFREDVEVVATK